MTDACIQRATNLCPDPAVIDQAKKDGYLTDAPKYALAGHDPKVPEEPQGIPVELLGLLALVAAAIAVFLGARWTRQDRPGRANATPDRQG